MTSEIRHIVLSNNDISIRVFDSPKAVIGSDEQHGVARVHWRERRVVLRETHVRAIPRGLIGAAACQSLHRATKDRIYIALAAWRWSKCLPIRRKMYKLVVYLATDWGRA